MVDLDELLSALVDHPMKFVGVIQVAGSIEDILKKKKSTNCATAQYLRTRAVEAHEKDDCLEQCSLEWLLNMQRIRGQGLTAQDLEGHRARTG